MSSRGRLKITIHIGQTIRVSAIIVLRGKHVKILYIVDCELTMSLKCSINLVPSYRAISNWDISNFIGTTPHFFLHFFSILMF